MVEVRMTNNKKIYKIHNIIVYVYCIIIKVINEQSLIDC